MLTQENALTHKSILTAGSALHEGTMLTHVEVNDTRKNEFFSQRDFEVVPPTVLVKEPVAGTEPAAATAHTSSERRHEFFSERDVDDRAPVSQSGESEVHPPVIPETPTPVPDLPAPDYPAPDFPITPPPTPETPHPEVPQPGVPAPPPHQPETPGTPSPDEPRREFPPL